MGSNPTFYESVPILQSLQQMAQRLAYPVVPSDWLVVITDIRGSTRAIEEGRYKEVNLVAASTIVAVLNVTQGQGIPYVFGGDGATLVIPPDLWPVVSVALAATQRMASQEFGFSLRVGMVPVTTINAAGHEIRVARLQVSPHYQQALFWGGGLSHAEALIKSPVTAADYSLPLLEGSADYSGLECRWQDLPSPQGEMLSLIVMASKIERYQSLLKQLDHIYGSSQQRRPVTAQQLRLTFDPQILAYEAKIRGRDPGVLQRENLLGCLLIRLKLTIGPMPWGCYRQIVAAATDYEKLDDSLRMVIAGSTQQRQQLMAYLEKEYQQGSLLYGVHVSDRALMTCLVFERHGQQVHFIDTADGGYALAAKAMKKRQQERRQLQIESSTRDLHT